MGAYEFEQYADGADPAAAFRDARDQALWENGHGGYTGTLAEKHEFTVITHAPLTRQRADALAADLLVSNDPRIRDKWGPAGAIPVAAEGQTVPTGWLFFGRASS